MKIHTVGSSDTIYSISKQYGVPEVRIITDNFLDPTKKLIVGQTLIISHPCKTCTVRGGDTLKSIAEENNISVLSLLQNNPQISGEKLTPSQTLNLMYNKENARPIAVAAYTDSANSETIEKYLPYISLLLVQNNAYITGSNISVMKSAPTISKLAKKYRAIPILVLECKNERGKYDGNCISNILNSATDTETFINSILNAVINNGYGGVELNASGINETDKYKFTDMFLALSGVCKEKNLQCSCPMLPTPDLSISEDNLMDISDYIPLWSYIWDNCSTASAAAPIDKTEIVLNTAGMEKYYNKLLLGIPTFGIDYTMANGKYLKTPIDSNDILKVIQYPSSVYSFDQNSGTPHLHFKDSERKYGITHIVCFEDASSISKKIELLEKYNLYGVNIMSLEYENPILWQLLNQRYNILKY